MWKFIKIHPSAICVLIASLFIEQLHIYTAYLVFIAFHEGVHAIVARALGLSVEEIQLSIFGAILHLKSANIKPIGQLWLHLSGPAGNFFLAILFCCAYQTSNYLCFSHAFFINIGLTIFNLLPIYPMDGGKIVFAYLTSFCEYGRSFQITYIFSCFFSLFLFFLGIYLIQYNVMNFFLSIMAVQCFLSARKSKDFFTFDFDMEKIKKQCLEINGNRNGDNE